MNAHMHSSQNQFEVSTSHVELQLLRESSAGVSGEDRTGNGNLPQKLAWLSHELIVAKWKSATARGLKVAGI